MSPNYSRELVRGIVLGTLIFLTVSSATTAMISSAIAQQTPLFSVTMIASTGNPVRRQYVTIIAGGMQSVGINARVFYMNFDQLFNRMWGLAAPVGSLFAQGGYDIGFIGFGPTSPVPDFRAQFHSTSMAPTGNNYALYNNTKMDSLLNELAKTTNVEKQVELTHNWQAILLHDSPYNYIYAQTYAVPRDPSWTAYGDPNVYNAVTFPDVEWWAGGKDLTFAEVSNIFPGGTLNPFSTASSNSFYNLYVYGAVCYSMAGLQYIDGRDNSFHNAIATDISARSDALTWTVKMRPGVLFQSGVEMTADDALFTRWAMLDARVASVALGTDIQYLGNAVDFKWLNGTTTTQDNRAKPDEPMRKGTWRAIDKYTFQFTLPEVYAFTNQAYCGFSILPKHIYEAFPPNSWDSQPFSTAEGPHKYTWDKSKYGGSGAYTAVGPVGAGTYILESYDFTKNLATLKKFQNHWAKSMLESKGYYTVETYKVWWIESKDAAIAALKNHEVNVLDNNYSLYGDIKTLKEIGANVITAVDLGDQEMGFNMRSPLFGTGVDTPAGKADPSQAAEAARHIRKAISYIIPRQLIVDQLLKGGGVPLATCIGPAWGAYYDSTLKADPYDPNKAVEELKLAGYTPSALSFAKIAPSGTPVLTLGTRVKGFTSVGGMIVVIEESTDQQNWRPVGAGTADITGTYDVSVPGPLFGSAYYRANFTGYAMNDTFAGKSFSVDQANAYIDEGQTAGGARLVQPSLTDPIAISTVANDAMGVLAIVIALIVIAVVTMRRRKTPEATAK